MKNVQKMFSNAMTHGKSQIVELTLETIGFYRNARCKYEFNKLQRDRRGSLRHPKLGIILQQQSCLVVCNCLVFWGDGVPKSSKSRLCMRLCTMTIRLYQCFDMP